MTHAGAAVTCVYQFVLSRLELIDWLHSDQRGNDLLSLNKEGVCSTCGYLGLYLMSVGLCIHLLRWMDATDGGPRRAAAGRPLSARPRGAFARGIAAKIVSLDTGLWLLLWLAERLQPVSRRACNAAYCLWVLATGVLALGLSWLHLCLLPPGGAPPGVLVALSRHMLPAFLGANVLTGAVNMAVDTMKVSDAHARAAVTAYALVLCAGAAGAEAACARGGTAARGGGVAAAGAKATKGD